MKLNFEDGNTGGKLLLNDQENGFSRFVFSGDQKDPFLTIAWNSGQRQTVLIDETEYPFPANHILLLVMHHSFRFAKPSDIIGWQFNRDFYCIADHDHEVSCAGFLFFHTNGPLFLKLCEEEIQKLRQLKSSFIEEYHSKDHLQGEMLRVLLKRLIIKLTRLARQQEMPESSLDDSWYHLFRKFNMLVEMHYKEFHQVQQYADLLNKSPKTLVNYFAQHHQPSPICLIHNRIIQEAKRLLIYTDSSAKEMAFDLGFDEPSNFSRLFKKETGLSPKNFREQFMNSKKD